MSATLVDVVWIRQCSPHCILLALQLYMLVRNVPIPYRVRANYRPTVEIGQRKPA